MAPGERSRDMSLKRRTEYANLVALAEELDSRYGRGLLQTDAVRGIICEDMSSADHVVRGVRSLMLKRFAEENGAKGEEL